LSSGREGREADWEHDEEELLLEGENFMKKLIPRFIGEGDCRRKRSLSFYALKNQMFDIRILKPRLALVLGAMVLLISCSRLKYAPGEGNVQNGIASWYGADFHGRPTSNREIYNMYDMTAAHRTLPFGTRVMVTNLNNGRAAVVRINDRGPFVNERIIDLSYSAARLLDMVESGIAPVRVEVLAGLSPPLRPSKFFVQVGSFIYSENARELENLLRKKFKNVYVSKYETSSQTYYRVRVLARDREASQKIAQKLCQDGYEVLILEEN
jgi:rare lipoprotein A